MNGSTPRRSIAFLVWRDTGHPEGGGSELFVERVARSMAQDGWDVTIVCAAYPGGATHEVRDAITFRRRGGRLTVYLHGLLYLLSARGRRTDLVVDVQNGLPFFSPLVRRRGVVVLVHHVHREQWQIIYPGIRGHIGWWLESRLAPRVYRGRPYVTVSEASRADLALVGVASERVDVVHNGVDSPHPDHVRPRSAAPRLCVLGRLVPHKQVEHALDALAQVRERVPDVQMDVIGDGWWYEQLRSHAVELDVHDAVTFHGAVDDATRDGLLDEAWVLLAPSVKEGWGIAIMEAAARGVPAIGYRSAGGVAESIVDGETGELVTDLEALIKRTELLLTDERHRTALSEAAARRAASFDWPATAVEFTASAERALGAKKADRQPR